MSITLFCIGRPLHFCRTANLPFSPLKINLNVSSVPIILPKVHFIKKYLVQNCIYENWFRPMSLFSVSGRYYSSADNWSELSYEDLKALINSKDIQLIDVREPKEIDQQGHLPNSINIPLGQLETVLGLSPSKFKALYDLDISCTNTNLVFSCYKGSHSYQAMMIARKLGYVKARHYGGGWEEWARRSTSNN